MGWGTFALGRILNKKSSATGKELDFIFDLIERKKSIEIAVYEKAKQLKSQGKDVDIDKVRKNIKQLEAYRRQKGRIHEIEIIKKAQELTARGLPVDPTQIEIDIINSKHYFSWKSMFIYLFWPFRNPLKFKFSNFIKKRDINF